MSSIYSFHADSSLTKLNQSEPVNKTTNNYDQSTILNNLLSELNGTSNDILASTLVSKDGLIVASSITIQLDEGTIGAMSAAMQSIGTRISNEFKRGTLEQAFIKGPEGYVLLTGVGANNVLSVITNNKAKLGFIFMESNHTASALSKLVK